MNRKITASLIVVLALAMGMPFTQPIARGTGPPYSWTGPTDIDQHLGTDNLPAAVTAANGTIWLAWQTYRYNTARPDIIYTTLTNGIVGPIGRITSSFYNSAPALAQLSNGTIMLFWSQRQTVSNIYYERFTVNQFGVGAWSSIVRLTTPTSFNDTAPSAAVGADGTLWLFFQRSNQSCTTSCKETRQIYFKTLTNGLWSSENRITSDANWNALPSAIVTKDRVVRLAWSKGGQSAGPGIPPSSQLIYYKTYNGVAWSGETKIVANVTGYTDTRPAMIQDRNGTMWLFWARTSFSAPRYVIYNQFSINNGQTWSAQTQMTTDTTSDSQQPAAAQANSNGDKSIHVFYSSDRINVEYDIWSLISPSISPIHDVGLTSVVNINFGVPWWYAGGLGTIEPTANITVPVQVVNYGDFGENIQATVTVTNTTTTSLGSQTQAVAPRGSTVFYFSWNTTTAKPAWYSLSVNVISTNSTETFGNQGDNSFSVKNTIHILPWGDVDQDGDVTLGDVSVFFYDFGFTPANPSRFNWYCDINGNLIIDIIDVGVAVHNFGIRA